MIKLLYRLMPVLLLLFACHNSPDLTEPVNVPPLPPSLDGATSPPHGSTAQSVTPILRWVCTDPDNDPLVYDLYFGQVNPPALIETDYPLTNYKPDTLNAGTTYYWRVVAKDPDHGHAISSPVWNFTTEISNTPALQISPTTLNFSTALSTIGVTISNRGGGILNWSLDESIPWLTLSTTNGTTQKEQDNITASINRNGLDVGVYSGQIAVTSNGGSATINVSMEVANDPTIAISTDSINIGTTGSQARFQINNSGSGTLHWIISDDQTYATTVPTTGTTTNETDTVRVIIDRNGLGVGDYLVRVTVTPDDGISRVVKVAFTVPGVPVLRVVPDSLGFADVSTQLSFEIANSGTGTLTWTVTDNRPWLSVSPINGTSSLESDTIQVNVDRTGLAPGTFVGFVSVMSNGGNALVKVSAIVRQLPQLHVSVDSVHFAGDEVQKTIKISNTGGETLTWDVTSNQPWLNFDPASGSTTSEQDELKLTVDRTSLGVGGYSAFLIVHSNDEDDTVAVTMIVPPIPKLAISSDTLSYGANDLEHTFTIQNSGTGTLSWILERDVTWLSASPTSGATTTESDQITVTVDRSSLTPGDYVGRLFASSDGGADTVYIMVTKPEVPLLNVSIDTLDFDESNLEEDFTINNAGTGTLTWNISESAPWLSVQPNAGQSTGENDLVTVTVDINLLGPGTHFANLVVTSNAGSDTVVARVSVSEHPALQVTPDTLIFGTDLTELHFYITNPGTGTLSWSVVDNQDWLIVSPLLGVTLAETDTLTASVDRSTLAPGSYGAKIAINSNAGPDTVVVSLDDAAIPVLHVSSLAVDFGDTQSMLSVDISNTGTGSLTWSIGSNRSWLSAIPDTGTTTSETDAIQIAIDRAQLPPGIHTGALTVSSNGGTAQIDVQVTVLEPPILTVAPPSLQFGAILTTLPLLITNTGGQTLSWAVVDTMPWLILSADSGSSTGESDRVDAAIDRVGLAPGVYTGSIFVSSNAGADTIEVSMTVPEEPELSVTPDTLDFSSDQVSQTLTIANTGTGSLSWTITDQESWLQVSPEDGVTQETPSEVTVSVDRTSLTPGSYTAILSIAGNDGSDSVVVLMTVLEPPTLGVSVNTLDFGTVQTELHVVIQNTGGSSLEWSVSHQELWLGTNTSAGSTTTEEDTLIVTVNRTGLLPQEYQDTLRITSNGGEIAIPVTMTVPAEPALGLSVDTIFFGPEGTESQFIISNLGDGTFTWSAVSDQSWLAVLPISGTVQTEEDTVIVSVTRDLLLPGPYTGSIIVNSTAGEDTVICQMEVPIPPTLAVDTDSLDFGTTLSDLPISISNVGTGLLRWQCVASEKWLAAIPDSGTTSAKADTVNIQVDRDQLRNSNGIGTYSATVTINSNGGTHEVKVSVTITETGTRVTEP